jgi:membrane protein implicated in regulation of membrane protease activity
MLFYGAACYTTGKAIQFNVLVWGGIASIVCGTVAFFLPFQYQLLLLMLAILVSYILPAHLMKKSTA